MYDDKELGAELQRLAGEDPLAPIDSQQLLTRGRRGRQRRRVLGSAGLAATVAVAVVGASLVPDIGQAGRDGDPIAGNSATPSAGPDFTPVPGVPRGDAAIEMTKKEAERRCGIRTGVTRELANYAPPFKVGETVGNAVAGDPAPGPYECTVPGDSRPSAAVIAKAVNDPTPADKAGQLRNCSVLFWHDMSDWNVVTTETLKGQGTVLVALSPSGRHVALCELGPKFDPKNGWPVGSGPAIFRTSLYARNKLQYFGEAGHRGDAGGCTANCVGWVYKDSGRVTSNIVRIRLTAPNGRTHDIKVVDGWYALSWANGDPQARNGGTVKAYDKNGNVVLAR
ncbi:hypothetical protein OG394_28715 [Kribbella sp. NBC_01245]|uniref:hypothetical protein n=1 Tax=Kribbella sp. NBC_01245 TaxID=2903578 RepID=UPI002E2E783E|nr:hypothetical protein [Kribbella sp. NBC_01245]